VGSETETSPRSGRPSLSQPSVIIVDMSTPAASSSPALTSRLRRLQRALHDLGLTDTVGQHWVSVSDRGFEFSTLTDHRADRFVRALEELAERVPDATDQLTLASSDLRDHPRKVSAPVRVPGDGAGAHLELP
jgi:hypothetical protein